MNGNAVPTTLPSHPLSDEEAAAFISNADEEALLKCLNGPNPGYWLTWADTDSCRGIFHMAAGRGMPRVLKRMVELGFDPLCQDLDGVNALVSALNSIFAMDGNEMETIDFLLDCGLATPQQTHRITFSILQVMSIRPWDGHERTLRDWLIKANDCGMPIVCSGDERKPSPLVELATANLDHAMHTLFDAGLVTAEDLRQAVAQVQVRAANGNRASNNPPDLPGVQAILDQADLEDCTLSSAPRMRTSRL